MGRRRRRVTATLGQIGSLDERERERERPRSDVHAIGDDAPTILLVDQDEDSRLALFHMLRRIYCVIGARDAATAIALCVQHGPAAIVSDAAMLDKDGERLDTLLRLALGRDAPPLIALGIGASDDALVSLDKPIDPARLIAAIEAVIEPQPAALRDEQAG